MRTEIPKLPGINHESAIRALRKAGFVVAREGKNTIMSERQRILTIPRTNPINAHTMGGIIRHAGLSMEKFKRLL